MNKTNTFSKIAFCIRVLWEGYCFLQQMKRSEHYQALTKQTPIEVQPVYEQTTTPPEIYQTESNQTTLPGNQIRLVTQIILGRSTLSISLFVLLPSARRLQRIEHAHPGA